MGCTMHLINYCFVCLCHYSSSTTNSFIWFCGYDVMVFPLLCWLWRVWLATCGWTSKRKMVPHVGEGEKGQRRALEALFSPLHSSVIGPEAGIVLPRTRATSPFLRDLRQFPGKWHDLIRRRGQLGQLMFPHDHPWKKSRKGYFFRSSLSSTMARWWGGLYCGRTKTHYSHQTSRV